MGTAPVSLFRRWRRGRPLPVYRGDGAAGASLAFPAMLPCTAVSCGPTQEIGTVPVFFGPPTDGAALLARYLIVPGTCSIAMNPPRRDLARRPAVKWALCPFHRGLYGTPRPFVLPSCEGPCRAAVGSGPTIASRLRHPFDAACRFPVRAFARIGRPCGYTPRNGLRVTARHDSTSGQTPQAQTRAPVTGSPLRGRAAGDVRPVSRRTRGSSAPSSSNRRAPLPPCRPQCLRCWRTSRARRWPRSRSSRPR